MSPFLRHPVAVAALIKTLEPSPLMLGPNITGTFDANRAFIVNYTTGSSGAIKSHRVVQQDWAGIGSGNSTTGSGFDLNAAWSNELFGASLTVQPKSLLFLPCIKI